ncbi:MAG: DUF4743 domain-containing protein [Gammaproteobacteria bacterium]|nr:DUF4743 domain-containing protein [Gammaproteobacteria bacterium]MCP5135628.1 DUF4743 domain-containing protein [Gammaproteobacteria bacterium]
MSYLDHIRHLNTHDLAEFRPWHIGDRRVGWLRPGFVEHLRQWPEVFEITPERIALAPALHDFQSRSAALASIGQQLIADGVIARWHGEPYGVTEHHRDQALCTLDRASATHYGILSFGQHMNGYVRDGDRLYLWIAKRAADKITHPGKLDHLVAGGLPHGMRLLDNLIKECGEEAGISPSLARQAQPIGCITYCGQNQAGLKPDVLYCYDLELPADFQPTPEDGEVESFQLLPIEEVAEIVRDTEEFKPNCNLVVIDFLIRHGVLGPDDPDYVDLITGLHPPHP